MRCVGIIPARMGSSRFPGKPLATIAGLPMIEHVYRRACMNPRFAEVALATCDEEIRTAAEAFGCRAIMTSPSHQRGTERVAEAALQIEADLVINIQGDEPLIAPSIFDSLIEPFDSEPGLVCTNLMARLTSDEEQDSLNNVKVVVDLRSNALYFSREPIPTRRMGVRAQAVYRQIGIYAFTSAFLRQFSSMEPTPCEAAESVDMMRILEHGYPIRMVETEVRLQSVDTPADLREAERLMVDDVLFAAYGRSRDHRCAIAPPESKR